MLVGARRNGTREISGHNEIKNTITDSGPEIEVMCELTEFARQLLMSADNFQLLPGRVV